MYKWCRALLTFEALSRLPGIKIFRMTERQKKEIAQDGNGTSAKGDTSKFQSDKNTSTANSVDLHIVFLLHCLDYLDTAGKPCLANDDLKWARATTRNNTQHGTFDTKKHVLRLIFSNRHVRAFSMRTCRVLRRALMNLFIAFAPLVKTTPAVIAMREDWRIKIECTT